jgi:hypothetical protein
MTTECARASARTAARRRWHIVRASSSGLRFDHACRGIPRTATRTCARCVALLGSSSTNCRLRCRSRRSLEPCWRSGPWPCCCRHTLDSNILEGCDRVTTTRSFCASWDRSTTARGAGRPRPRSACSSDAAVAHSSWAHAAVVRRRAEASALLTTKCSASLTTVGSSRCTCALWKHCAREGLSPRLRAGWPWLKCVMPCPRVSRPSFFEPRGSWCRRAERRRPARTLRARRLLPVRLLRSWCTRRRS